MEAIVFFDSECLVCNRSIQFLLRHDKYRKFRFASLGSKTFEKLRENFPEIPTNPETMIVLSGEYVSFRSESVLKICQILGGCWRFFDLVRIFPRTWLDACYNVFAKHRYRIFCKQNSCLILPQELLALFLP